MKYWLLFILGGPISLNSCLVPDNKILKSEHRTSGLTSIDSFKVPDDIEGCGYYFAADQISYKKSDYLFVANRDSVGYISVGQKLVKLRLVSSTRDPENFGDHVDTYISNNYQVTVEINYIAKVEQEESWTAKGTMTIESLGEGKAVRKLFGERGC